MFIVKGLYLMEMKFTSETPSVMKLNGSHVCNYIIIKSSL